MKSLIEQENDRLNRIELEKWWEKNKAFFKAQCVMRSFKKNGYVYN